MNTDIQTTLQTVRNICNKVLSLTANQREILFLEYFSLFLRNNKKIHNGYIDIIVSKTKEVIKEFPEDTDKLTSSRCSLIEKDLDEINFKFDMGAFDQYMFIFKTTYEIINDLLNKSMSKVIDKKDKYMLDMLKRLIKNTLIDNPNFKPSENISTPYYKRKYKEFNSYLLFSKTNVLKEIDNMTYYFIEENAI